MNKDVKYNGYAAQPSDYQAPDGQLDLALNVANDSGCISPLQADGAFRCMPDQDFEALYIHQAANYRNIILWNTDTRQVYWIAAASALNGTQIIALSELTPIAVIDDAPEISCTAIGNTLVLASSAGVEYALWNGTTYDFLGSRPDFISIEFGMVGMNALDLGSVKDIPIETPLERTGSGGKYSETAVNNITNFVYGRYLAKVNELQKKGYFTEPFFIRYAFRLYDGTYSWHSAPVLMLPTVAPPYFRIIDSFPELSESTKIHFSCLSPYYDLRGRILKCGTDTSSKWKDIVSAIDIFVSAPIYTWDQSKPIVCQSGKVLTTQWGKLAASNFRGFSSEDSRSGNVLPGGSSSDTPGIGDENTDIPTGIDAAPDTFFIGRFDDTANSNNIFTDLTVLKSNSIEVFNVPPNENFHRDVVSRSLFYKVASIPFENIKPTDDFRRVVFTDVDLTNLTSRPTLPDDYMSQQTLCAKGVLVYNRRLHLFDSEITPAKPYPFRSVAPAHGDARHASTNKKVTVTVYIRKEIASLSTTAPEAAVTVVDASDAYCIPSLASCFPRWIYYPDPRAFKMKIVCGSDTIYIPLKPHDFLNGAYYYGSFNVSPIPATFSAPSADENFVTSYNQSHKLYVSDVDNPFVFQSTNIYSLPDKILALASAAKPLSQGQFGDFPLYVFTDQGVWALRVGSTGTYTSQTPVTRDAIISPRSIVSLDSSVIFVTERGIMLLSGSQAECISESIDNRMGYADVSALPSFSSLHKLIGHTRPDLCFPLPKLSDFLAGARCAYDYITQRLLFFNPDRHIALVYSLRSRLWYQREVEFNYALNSYPNLLVVDNYNRFKTPFTVDTSLSGLLITRPLKLDAPDVLKTVDTVIQRGHFRRGHVQSVLYGSRDLINWHLVWSSKDHYLRGFRGTPYKYFRIALLCNLAPGESIYGASVQFTPRLTNQPR